MVLFIESKPQDIVETEMQSLNSSNVHEPRNAEFTAFFGSFLVEWQSNDNNIGKYEAG